MKNDTMADDTTTGSRQKVEYADNRKLYIKPKSLKCK